MTTATIHPQMVFLSDTETYIFLREVMFDGEGGWIRFNDGLLQELKTETFEIKEKQMITESYHLPIQYLLKWLEMNGCLDERGNVTDMGFNDINKQNEL